MLASHSHQDFISESLKKCSQPPAKVQWAQYPVSMDSVLCMLLQLLQEVLIPECIKMLTFS